eukprot:GFYU01011002.1.p1 GENE.GFYU01011002.1~~GFYU01011002.1.p1  ORF type:complete len:501 (+),score=123.70 GFYU01011002.1:68-1504(+)
MHTAEMTKRDDEEEGLIDPSKKGFRYSDGSASSEIVDYEDEIEATGPGAFQRMVVAACGVGNAADAVEMMCISFIIPELDESISSGEQGILSAAVFAGMLVGGCIAGVASDRFGRRPFFLLSMAVNGLFGALTAVAPTYTWIVLCRLCSGIGVGGSVPVVFSMCSEFLPRSSRGFYLTFVAVFWMLGGILAVGIAWMVMPTMGWRWYAFFCSIPAFCTLFFVYMYIPESPRYLLLHGREAEAAEVLKRVAIKNDRESLLIPGVTLAVPAHSAANSWSEQLRKLGSKNIRRPLILLIIVWFTISFGWYGLLLWIPEIFKKLNVSMDIYANTMMVQLATGPGNLAAMLAMDRIGRKYTMAAAMFCSSAFALAFAYADTATTIVVFACFFNAVSNAGWTALNCLSTESFPTSIRSSAMGALTASGRVASVLAQVTNGILISEGVGLILTITCSMMLAGCVAVLCLPVETAKRKLEDDVGSD